MRIDRLALQNFKCFENREFSFHPQFNLIVGENGTGKTSILDALSIGLATWLLGFRNKPDKRGIEPGEPRLAKRLLDGSSLLNGSQRLDGRLRQLGKDGKPRFAEQYPVRISTAGEVMGQTLAWCRSKESEEGKTRYGEAGELLKAAAQADQSIRNGEAITLPLIAYYGTMRLWQEPRKLRQESRITNPKQLGDQRRITVFEGYRHSVDPRISVESLISWFARQAWATFQEGETTPSLRVVKNAILGCLDNASSLYFDAKMGELLITINGNTQPFSNLSDGQRCMLALVADIAQKAEWLNPHLSDNFLTETPGVVLIDELDLHLHPKWQRRVIEDLRRTFPKIQFICTTHSPFLIQSLRSSDELIMLDGQPTDELANLGIEAIATGIMGVENPEASPRYMAMLEAAKGYLAELDEAAKSPAERLAEYKRQLEERIAPFADNPAFQAVLEAERISKLGD